MKIGLLTFHTYNNYGALLQTYATLHVLQDLGFDCDIINLRRRPKNKLLSFFYNNVCSRNFEQFREEFLNPRTKQYYTGDDLSELNSEYDCFLVGSDQVWRPQLTGDLALNYFLDFADEHPLKISYSSSFGISEWSEKQELTLSIKKLLQRFDAISVREDAGVMICQNDFDVKATLVLDPTLLLNEQDYTNLLGDIKIKLPTHYATTFFLDNVGEFETTIRQEIRDLKRIPTISLSIPELKFLGSSYYYNPRKVLEWIYVLKNTEFIITESFHCVVFAIIFRKKFVCVINHKRGKARLLSFLKMLGLTDLLIEKKECTGQRITELLMKTIDFDQIDSILADKKSASINFLERALRAKIN